ncbi:MAG TPA: helix-turn-helix domain-containing protein [Candidatus Eremiobacteraceae bacterium]|nr:helix-turn-helix domain-containing protein [Candidatus Eremiobacteraceae bacterium]
MATSATAQGPRVDPRVTRTQKLIRDALMSLLAEKSFESISVQDIAERATVNRATFYAHFSDKFALLEVMTRDEVGAKLSEGDPLNAPDTRELLKGVGRSVFGFVGQHSHCKVDRDFEPQFESAIEARVTEFLQPSFNDCSARLIASALVGAAMNWRHQAPKMRPDPIVDNIVGILVDGVEKQRT